METLNQILARNTRMIPDRPFLIAGERVLTYGDFSRETARLAHVLSDQSVVKGDRVGLYLPSTPLMAIGFWACQRMGAIPVPLSAMLRHDELRKIIAQTDMAAFIADVSTYPYFATIRSEFPSLHSVLAGGGPQPGAADLDGLTKAAPTEFSNVERDAQDTAALFFTSGTTGSPKGTAQSQFNHYSTLRDMMVGHRTRFASETYLCAVPLFTNFGCTVTLNLCLYTGGKLILHERWDTARVLDDIKRHRVTYFGGTPTMYVYMVNEFDPARHDLSSLRLCTTGGSPVPRVIMQRFEELSGAPVIQVYGSTETLGQNVMEPTAGVRRPGSTGLALGSSRIEIVNDEGEPVPAGEIGEVVISGDCVSKGYWGDAAATAAVFTPRGWLSGDLGYVDKDGYLFIVDRKKDVIIAGGHNVYPLEIETLLYQHPDIDVCTVVGVPDESKGEIPVAIIVRRPGTVASAGEVIAYCREHVAAYKAPRQVYFVDEIPLQAGKIRKRDLVEAIKSGRLQPAG